MPNSNTILIARTIKEKHDSTEYIFHWAENVKNEAELLGMKVIDLKEENFNEENLLRMIEQFDPYIIFLNGHGTEYSIRGKDGETDIIIRCKNDHLFKDRVVYALSCSTANILGKSAHNKGCKSYIGYNRDIVFPNLEKDNPLEDDISKSFMMVSNEIVITLIKGGSPEEAIQNFHKLSDELISYWGKSDSSSAPIIQRYLERFKKIIYAHSL